MQKKLFENEEGKMMNEKKETFNFIISISIVGWESGNNKKKPLMNAGNNSTQLNDRHDHMVHLFECHVIVIRLRNIVDVLLCMHARTVIMA